MDIRVNSWSRVNLWLIYFCLLSVACSKPTSPDTGPIHGKVLLEGQSDHSGVRVSLYLPSELDPEIMELNQKYPNIGVPISQHTEFDHRLARELATTTTAADLSAVPGTGQAGGSFELKDIPQGQYILVAQKEGYGWQYLFDLTYSASRVTNHAFPLPETQLTGLIPSDTVWKRDRHYIITGDVTVPKEVTLTIEPGVWVRFDGYYKLKVEGRLNALGEPDNMITFTLNHGFTSHFALRTCQRPPGTGSSSMGLKTAAS